VNLPFDAPRVGYVLKRYPRYSETFIVNEILAHECAGARINIFSLRPSLDSHFQDRIAKVRAPVTYLLADGVKASEVWAMMHQAAESLPGFWEVLKTAGDVPINEVYQAILLARHIEANDLTHLHAHFATSATTVARLAAKFAGVSYTLTAHAKDIFHDSIDRNDVALKLRDAAAVVTVSDYNVRFLQEMYGADAAHVVRVYNGMDLEHFPYAAPEARAPRIISVGRLIEKKGFRDLLQACALLARRKVDFVCQIVGSGELEAELRLEIIRLELQDRVELLGPRPQSEVIQLVQQAAVMAAPCVVGSDGNRDGLPTVLLEAMALGTPSVSTDVTGIPEVVKDDETGLMVPQHNPLALSNALQRLLSDSVLRVRLASKARELMAAEFDIHCNAARIRDLFCAGGKPVSAPASSVLQEVS
jgi:colanic acid/amylovoran biosynthesis glycosyltransferase